MMVLTIRLGSCAELTVAKWNNKGTKNAQRDDDPCQTQKRSRQQTLTTIPQREELEDC